MKTYLDCIPCFMNQALRVGRLTTTNEAEIKQLLNKIGAMIKDVSMENAPPETSECVYRELSKITGIVDPYREIKKQNIQEALALYPELKEIVRNSENPLLTAVRIAIAGNVIDLGIDKAFDIVKEVKKVLTQDFSVFDYEKFEFELEKAETILYLGDNSGESVFDKILIEELGKKVIYAVREKPIINDVTYQEAIESGLDQVAEIISSGSTAAGTILSLCNPEFIELFNTTDMIISKGQGNYEGLSESSRSVFFLLKAKCSVIARDLGVAENGIILKAINC